MATSFLPFFAPTIYLPSPSTWTAGLILSENIWFAIKVLYSLSVLLRDMPLENLPAHIFLGTFLFHIFTIVCFVLYTIHVSNAYKTTYKLIPGFRLILVTIPPSIYIFIIYPLHIFSIRLLYIQFFNSVFFYITTKDIRTMI